jgi:hypothetical protein
MRKAPFAALIVALNIALIVATLIIPQTVTVNADTGVSQPLSLTPELPQAIYRVTLRTSADAQLLLSTGYDVLEAREGDDVFILADEAATDALRTQGYVINLHTELTTHNSQLIPQTYFGGYRTVVEHWAHLDAVAAAHPDLTKLVDYGDSWRKVNNVPNGHDLRAICITKLREGDCALDPETDKPRFLVIAATHARELSTSEMAWRFMDLLVEGYSADADITALLDYNEIWIVPVVNPDGRTIVEQGGSNPLLQRKNTNYALGNCAVPNGGVDLNRNGSYKWGAAGTSTAPCSSVYLGQSQASEPEQYYLETLMGQLFRDQRDIGDLPAAPITTTGSMLTLHSFGNMVLLPWGWTECFNALCPPSKRAPNDAGLRAWGFRMSHYNGYVTGQSSEVLYAAAGVTDDWAYGVLGIPGATFEIGPSSGTCGGGFTPPYSCQDGTFWPLNRGALLYAAKLTRQPYALSLGPNTLSVTVSVSNGVVMTGTAVTITATINDNAFGNSGYDRPASQVITAAELYLDAPPWAGGAPITMTARDGAFNSNTEVVTATLDTTSLSAGRHMVFVRGKDAAGNWGPVTAQWLTVLGDKRIFVPALRHDLEP